MDFQLRISKCKRRMLAELEAVKGHLKSLSEHRAELSSVASLTNPDPCLEQQNAFDAAAAEVDALAASLDAATIVLLDRAEILLQCRMEHPGSG